MLNEVRSASRLRFWIGAVAVAAVGTVLRCEYLTTISFWFDESFTWKTISFPWSELLARVARDNQPPLYYAMLKLWSQVWGNSPLALRGFSVLCGMGTVWAVFLFVRDAYRGAGSGLSAQDSGFRVQDGPRPQSTTLDLGPSTLDCLPNSQSAAALAATLVALAPFQIQWAVQARMYTLLTLMVALSSWLMVRALARPGSLGRWTAFTIAAAAVGYTHYYGLFAVAAQFLFLFALAAWRKASRLRIADCGLRIGLGTAGKPRPHAHDNLEPGTRNLELIYVLAAAAGVWLIWAPWAPTFLRQLGQVHEAFWIRPVDWRILAMTIYQMFSYSQYDGASDDVVLGVLELCALSLAALVTWRARAIDRYVALAAALPFAASVAASSLGVRVFETHYFLAAQLFFLAAAAALVGRVRTAAVRRMLAAGLVAGSAVLCAVHWQKREGMTRRPGALGATAWLDGARKPGEPVIVCSPMIATTIAAHAASSGPIYVYRWPQFAYRHFHGTAVFDDSDYVTASDLRGLSGDWAWVVDTDGWDNGTFTVPMPRPWVLRVEERFKEIYGKEYDLVIRLYQRDGSRIQTMAERKPEMEPRTNANGRR